ncbi:hypothetical protein [Neolewinella antarctica]|uniref:Uncharacterized protein n=1 Tax=Neolewinella antarctica TaxID=442734 RepID=A0ABX0XEV0_9BACT|nr:hypothetical protein [Neolewinella antarctica]NJC27849.1 hypothetical protein [Neolewinella antarctica]
MPAQSEAAYINALAKHLHGRTEVPVTSGRADIVTADYAIEVERAANWKHSIGQALWYGLQTNRRAGIILILGQENDFTYFQQLNSALNHGGLSDKIETWVYPNDFPGVSVGNDVRTYSGANEATRTDYWLSANSSKRHGKTCRWYETSKGRYSSANEGTAAGCCH